MLYRVAAFAALGGFLYGYDLGLIGGAMLNIHDQFHTSTAASEVIVGAAKIGAFFGTFLGGAMMLYYGRRKAIAMDSIFFMAGPVIMAAAYGVTGLVVGRVVVGLGIGISAVVVPAYLGEVAPAKSRGKIVEIYEVMLCLGMLCSVLADVALQDVHNNWRWMVGLPFIPGFILSAALLVLPESPRWLVVNGHLDEALAIIHRVYTHHRLPQGAQESTAEVEHELMDLWSSVEKDKAAQRERLQDVRRNRTRRDPDALPLKKGWHLGKARKFHTLEQSVGDLGSDADVLHIREPRGKGLEPSPDVELGRRQVATPVKQEPIKGMALPSESELSRLAVQAPPPLQPSAQRAGPRQPGRQLSRLHDVSRSAAPPEGDSGASTSGQTFEQIDLDGSNPFDATADDSRGGDGLSSPTATSEELSNPSSSLYRSLSEVPKGLPRIRTKSDAEELTRGVTLAPHHLAERVSPGGELQQALHQEVVGFWGTLWNMLQDIYVVATGPERNAVHMALWLAFFDQGIASTAIINYAPVVLEGAGVRDHMHATLLSSTITGSKIMGVVLAMFLVDTAGRRPLLIYGSFGSALGMVLLTAADALHSAPLVVVAMCLFILAFSMSYAGIFWVLVSEIFSMSAKSPAASAATAMLFASGAAANLVFLSLHDWLGAGAFLVFATIAASGGVYCYIMVPETKGRTMAEVQVLLARGRPNSTANVAFAAAAAAAAAADSSPGGAGAAEQGLVIAGLARGDQQARSLLASAGDHEDSAPEAGLPRAQHRAQGVLDRLRAQWSGYSRYQGS
ncbi:hypothetical protein WJX72_012503 [[Myrmecia] bisecta]|uniref:Major facilitator superfamily (MFS) profile domain-containing protein n=1 Tax=[Myrmecia] bisecta TaxID=41462 RepID=A0AAW1Q5Y4_9CHLO